MVIGGVSGTNKAQAGLSGMNMQEDSISKDLKRQMEKAQKQLQEISSNQDLSMEEKMKKRQEIQQEIASLNQQLRQHQIELRREQQTAQRQSKGDAMDEVLGSPADSSKKADNSGSGLSQASMQSMISADTSMKQAQVQGSVAMKMENRANVLETEIKQDGGKGENSLKAKEEELAEVGQKAQDAAGAQASALANANQAANEAAKAEQGGQSKEKESEEEKDNQAQKENRAEWENAYTAVDIRL